MKNRINKLEEGGCVISICTDEGEAAKRAWTIATRPQSEITHQDMGVLQLVVAPEPTYAKKTSWGTMLLDICDTIEGVHFAEHFTNFDVVRENSNLTFACHLKDGFQVLQVSSLACRDYPVELPFPRFFKALRTDDQLSFASLVFEAVGERDEIMSVRDN